MPPISDGSVRGGRLEGASARPNTAQSTTTASVSVRIPPPVPRPCRISIAATMSVEARSIVFVSQVR